MSVYKVPDSNSKEGLRITTKEGMTVTPYKLQLTALFALSFPVKIEGITAGVYLSSLSPGVKYYLIITKNLGELYLDQKDLGKMVVYVDSTTLTDVLGRKWKLGDNVYSAGANIRTSPTTSGNNIWQSVYTGLVGRFSAKSYDSAGGEWLKTDTNRYIFSSLSLQQPASVSPAPSPAPSPAVPVFLTENKSKIGITLITLAIGGIIWGLSGKSN